VLERRVEAVKIGMAGQKPLAEVALDAGFSSQSHFTTAFRLTTGMTPCQWRRAQATD
jgi:AraC family transcriptional regulator